LITLCYAIIEIGLLHSILEVFYHADTVTEFATPKTIASTIAFITFTDCHSQSLMQCVCVMSDDSFCIRRQMCLPVADGEI